MEKKADGWINRKARAKMGQIAASMVGHHYVKGGKGARPGQNDGAPPRRGNITLLMSANVESPAFLAAGSPLDVTYVCGGRYGTIGRSPVAPSDLRNYLKGQDPSNPGRCYTLAGLTPRRVIASSETAKGGPLVWGQCCDGWRHFDCLGLVDFAFAQGSEKTDTELRNVQQWASPKNSVKATRVVEGEEILDGDLVSLLDKGVYHHIGMIYLLGGQALVAQAQETAIGVTVGTAFNRSEWTGGQWRLPDAILRADWSVDDVIPSIACQPSVNARSEPA